MSAYSENLGRAARLLKLIDDIGEPRGFEDVPIKQLVADVLEAQRQVILQEALDRVAVFACEPDESAGFAENVYPLIRHAGDDWSKKAGA